ncbi:MAG: hypothetical protein J6T58_00910, partial [Bacteroidales bacterium]|nr:hypothetical protein [Bacteroidales bacterium]
MLRFTDINSPGPLLQSCLRHRRCAPLHPLLDSYQRKEVCEAGKRRPEDRQCYASDITRLDQRKQCEHPAALRTSGAGSLLAVTPLPPQAPSEES